LSRNWLPFRFGGNKSGQKTAVYGDRSRPNMSSAILQICRLQTAFHLQDLWNGIWKLADAKLVLQTVTPLLIKQRWGRSKSPSVSLFFKERWFQLKITDAFNKIHHSLFTTSRQVLDLRLSILVLLACTSHASTTRVGTTRVSTRRVGILMTSDLRFDCDCLYSLPI
jgi:hypothetical protein